MNRLSALTLKSNEMWVRPGTDDQIIFQAQVVRVISQVNSWIYAPKRHAPISGHVRPPIGGIIANEVIYPALKRFLASTGRGAIAPLEFEPEQSLRLYIMAGCCLAGCRLRAFTFRRPRSSARTRREQQLVWRKKAVVSLAACSKCVVGA